MKQSAVRPHLMMNQSTLTSDLNDPNDLIDDLAASLPPLPELGLLQMQEIIGTRTLGDVVAADIGT